jgi:hypothetical protein
MAVGQKLPEDEFSWVADNISNPAVMGLLYKYRGLASSSGFLQARNQVILTNDSIRSPGGGSIGYIQESGYKLRAVANPYRVHQVILEPLKNYAGNYLRSCPTDCTFDQESGQVWAQQKLREGKTLHAVDLSDATNNVPLLPQLFTLVTALRLDLGNRTTSDLLHYFAEVSRLDWKDPHSGDSIRWNRGQPMGLGPSFFVFAIWHNATLRIANRQSGSKIPWEDAFRIVGDDVVIACDDTHKKYRQILDKWAIPISESKSLSSKECTEFVGKVITKGSSYAIPKFQSLSDRNFLDVLKQFGPQSISWCKPRQKAVAKILAQVPEEFGGLGWNPKGLSLETRVNLAFKLGLLEEEPETLPSRNRSRTVSHIFNKIGYHSGLDLTNSFLREELKGRDQSHRTTSPMVLKKVFTIDKDLGMKLLLDDLGSITVDGDSNPIYLEDTLNYRHGAPLSKGDPRGSSQLENWERKIENSENSGEWTEEDDLLVRNFCKEILARGKLVPQGDNPDSTSHALISKKTKRPKP